jgi:hypothetical protein
MRYATAPPAQGPLNPLRQSWLPPVGLVQYRYGPCPWKLESPQLPQGQQPPLPPVFWHASHAGRCASLLLTLPRTHTSLGVHGADWQRCPQMPASRGRNPRSPPCRSLPKWRRYNLWTCTLLYWRQLVCSDEAASEARFFASWRLFSFSITKCQFSLTRVVENRCSRNPFSYSDVNRFSVTATPFSFTGSQFQPQM